MGIPVPGYDAVRDGVTVSLLQNFLACRVRAKLSLEGWTPVLPKSSRIFGSLFHAQLQHVYEDFRLSKLSKTKKAAGRRIAKLSAEFVADWKKQALQESGRRDYVQALVRDSVVAQEMMAPYLEQWPDDFTKERWLAVETQFDVTTAVPIQFAREPSHVLIRLRGKRDGIMRRRGRIWVLETKTRAQIKHEEIIEQLQFDLQSLFYCYATFRETGKRPVGVIYNVVRRPQLRQGEGEKDDEFIERILEDIAERQEFYFARFEALYTVGDQKRFEKELSAKLAAFYLWSKGYLPTYRSETSCFTRFRCDYVDHCTSGNLRGYVQKRGGLFSELEEE